MAGLLFSAYQKFYSALSSLDRFDKEGDFFDNISCLDTFFSEYRNITFAIQSSLKHTDYFSAYEKYRDAFLKDHWFIDKRNQTTKEKPFRLIKEISITLYLPYHGFSVLSENFSVENDTPLSKVFDKIKSLFAKFTDEEIFFSASFDFHEADNDIDLFDKLLSGIGSMQKLLTSLDKEINQSCPLCNQIKEKINDITIAKIPKEYLLINDYVYYPKKDCFERGMRFSLSFEHGEEKLMHHVPISALTNSKLFNYDGTPFGNFTFMHAIIRSMKPGADIMPVIMTIYDNQTYDLDVFHADIKTTVYRKINEVAKKIKTDQISEVCFLSLYAVLTASSNALSQTSKKRLQLSQNDILVSASIDCRLNELEYVFEGKMMENPQYVLHVLKNECSHKLNFSRNNMFPIWNAFNNKITSNL